MLCVNIECKSHVMPTKLCNYNVFFIVHQIIFFFVSPQPKIPGQWTGEGTRDTIRARDVNYLYSEVKQDRLTEYLTAVK